VRYPSVYRAHIVPAGYLRAFASQNKIAVRKLGAATSSVKPVEKAGTRPRFYRRTRPSGDKIDDVEWSLSHIEDKAPPILRAIDELWPLDRDAKSVLAELFGYQVVRGPRWADWHNRFVGRLLQELFPDGGDSLHQAERHLLSDTYRMTKMLDLGLRLTSLFGSMHWFLLQFATPLVVTSDHPVVVWPLDVRGRPPRPTNDGPLNALEVRVPISPTRAVLMTWLNVNDAPGARFRCTRDQARNLNAFTVANADREWFHLPGTTPPIGAGSLLPLSPALINGYGTYAVQVSQRRAQVREWLEKTKNRTLRDREKLILT
jgi:uncharacterized protein DUF4238